MFERDLALLEPSPWLRKGGLVAMGIGAIALASWMLFHFGPGALGLSLVVIGFLTTRGTYRTTLRARRVARRVTVVDGGLAADGVVVAARSAIVQGYYQPRTTSAVDDGVIERAYGSSVRILGANQVILAEVECDPTTGDELLAALGLAADRSRAEFRGSSPLFTTQRRIAALLAPAAILGLLASMTSARIDATLVSAALFLLVALVPARPTTIAVGSDGILVRWWGRERFVAMRRVRDIRASGPRTVRLVLDDGEQVLQTAVAGDPRFPAGRPEMERRDALLSRLQAALAAHRARGPVHDLTGVLEPGDRTRQAWVSDLVRLRDGDEGYRRAAIPHEDLWQTLENPAASEDARAAAALLLRRSLDVHGKARVRIAAEATASPKLRIALDRVASAEHEADVEAAVTEVASQRVRRAKTS